MPAGWLVAVLAILRFTLGGRRIGTLGLVGLLWSLAPQRLKLALAGLGVASVIVLAGALAALALLVIQLFLGQAASLSASCLAAGSSPRRI